MALRLGELLVQQGALSQGKLDEMLQRQRAEHRRLGEMLVSEGLLEAKSLREALAQQSGTTAIALGDMAPQPEVMAMMPAPLMRRFESVPIRVEGSTLVVGMVDPLNTVALDAIRTSTGFNSLSVRVIAASEFAEWALAQLSVKPELSALLDAPPEHVIVAGTISSDDEEPLTDSPPVVAVVDYLLTEAVRRSAGSIHLEPFETTSRIRLRIDGALQTLITLPRRLHRAVVARIQSMAHADYLDFGTTHGRGRYRLRTAEAVHGRAVTLRSQALQTHSLTELGFTKEQTARLERIVNLSQGLLVVAGPKDSGRTTVASSLLEIAARNERQIVTVSRHGGVGLSGAISFTPERIDEALSQDPDVVLIDDVPLDKVSQAAQAALDGRLVILTVSGSRAIHSIRTLSTLGSAWRLAATLQAVAAVRLLRQVCEDCAIGLDLDINSRREIGLPDAASPNETFRRGKGCASCWGTGYQGRLLVGEVAFSSPGMREAILAEAEEAELMEIAREDGFHTVWELGVLATVQGKTTVDELRIALTP